MNLFKDKIFVILFTIACLLNTAPIFFNTFVLSLDGPAHLYNSNLIAELIRGNAFVGEYVSFNNLHFTNWSGHLILTLFNLIAPAWIAQKAFLILLVIAFTASFAFMVSRLNYKSRYMSFIIFPFTYSTFFFLGFYNFLLAIIFFFVLMAVIYKEKPVYSTKEKIWIFVLLLLIECSHIFVLLIALGIFFIVLIYPVFQQNKFRLSISFREMRKPLINYFILCSGAIVLFLFYFINNAGYIVEKPEVQITWAKIFSDIYNISLIRGLGEHENNVLLSSILFGLLALTTLVLLIKKSPPEKKGSKIYILFPAIIFLCFYVLTMVFLHQGFYIQVRCLLLFFILILVWISLQKVPKILQVVLVIYCLYISTVFLDYYQKSLSIMSRSCYNIYDTGWRIEKNARIYCINFSNHWLESHILDYLGADNSLVLYDNYECYQNYFPLKWKDQEFIQEINNGFYAGAYTKAVSDNVDYVAVLDEPDQQGRDKKNGELDLTKTYFSIFLISPDKRLTLYRKIKKK